MTTSALHRLSSPSFLKPVWNEMYRSSSRDKRDGFGVDGLSIRDLTQEIDYSLRHISGEMRSGQFYFRKLSPRFLPKGDGKDRVICVPTVIDRLVQRAVLKFLSKHGYSFTNSISYGFVKGRSVKGAVKRAQSLRKTHQWCFKTDISSFFDEIDREYLVSLLRKKIPYRSLYPLLESAVSVEVDESGVEARLRKMGLVKGRGIRQGMPVSPYFSNLVLADFDRAAEDKGYKVVRYADDIVAFADSEEECQALKSFCVDQLSKVGEHGLSLSESKTTISSPDEGVPFLGMSLEKSDCGYSLRMTKQQLLAVENKILNFSDINYCLKRGVDIAGFLKRLEGVGAGYLGAYDLCDNQDALYDIVSQAKNKALKDMLEKNFGVVYSSLSNRKKEFLNLS